MNYLKDDGEIAAFSALPAVLKRGVEIYRENDHKGKGYSTVTFAAPVVINNVRGNMAVVVRETSKNHYDMHRIVMPDGTAFAFENERNAESGPTAATPNNGALTQPTDSASESTIPVNGKDVKGKFSPKTASAFDSTGRELSEQQQEHFKNSKVRDGDTLYMDKKRAASVLRRMGYYTPISILRNGYTGSISCSDNKVKIEEFLLEIFSGDGERRSLKTNPRR